MKRRFLGLAVLAVLLAAGTVQISSAPGDRMLGINVVLNADIVPYHLSMLGQYGKVRDVVYEIKAVTLQAPESVLPAVQALPFVLAANPDAERQGAPVDTVAAADFSNGWNTWDLDAIDVTNPGANNRQVAFDGTGVYVAVLDTGLLDSWRQYFPQERIAVQYAKCFGGGGGDNGAVSEQPNKWEHDQNSHGTHVASTILGYSMWGTPVNGVAPMATVIPVKILNQTGWGWSSVIARGIVYIAQLKMGPLAGQPVVINMSLGGFRPDPMEIAAIDYAISKGVIVVAAAGNYGDFGMIYPAAYEPVISVGASGWTGEWTSSTWWWAGNVPDPTNPADYYVGDFSSRAKTGQYLDVLAPGTWVLGPYQLNSGQLSYWFLQGTSMSTPHVAGIVALMLDKNGALTTAQAEGILETSAVPLPPGCRTVNSPYGVVTYCWGANATGFGLATASAALAITP